MEDIGQVLENIVCLEILRRGYTVTVGMIGNEEIDFIGVKNNKPIYVQVAYVMPDKKTQEREFGNLLKIKDNYPKLVVSMDEVDMPQSGIIHLNIKDFLLREWA
jgi:predicted AAA+ superfamily ATPase